GPIREPVHEDTNLHVRQDVELGGLWHCGADLVEPGPQNRFDPGPLRKGRVVPAAVEGVVDHRLCDLCRHRQRPEYGGGQDREGAPGRIVHLAQEPEGDAHDRLVTRRRRWDLMLGREPRSSEAPYVVSICHRGLVSWGPPIAFTLAHL